MAHPVFNTNDNLENSSKNFTQFLAKLWHFDIDIDKWQTGDYSILIKTGTLLEKLAWGFIND